MLLTIDAGNTNTVFAIFDGNAIVGQWRMATDSRRTADEYGVWLLQLLALAGIKKEKITAAIISSVVPQSLFALKTFIRDYFKTAPLIIGDPAVKIPIQTRIDRPSEIGADRLVNAVAAWQKYKMPLIILDFGTATTFDVVDDAGDHIGGVIAPGINLSLEALHRAAAKLPNIAVTRPASIIGKATEPAMQSGVYYGYMGLIEGITTRIKQEFGKPMKVIATGGLAPLFSKESNSIEHLEPDLTHWGMKAIYDYNKN